MATAEELKAIQRDVEILSDQHIQAPGATFDATLTILKRILDHLIAERTIANIGLEMVNGLGSEVSANPTSGWSDRRGV